jgi:hypothetical protein
VAHDFRQSHNADRCRQGEFVFRVPHLTLTQSLTLPRDRFPRGPLHSTAIITAYYYQTSDETQYRPDSPGWKPGIGGRRRCHRSKKLWICVGAVVDVLLSPSSNHIDGVRDPDPVHHFVAWGRPGCDPSGGAFQGPTWHGPAARAGLLHGPFLV